MLRGGGAGSRWQSKALVYVLLKVPLSFSGQYVMELCVVSGGPCRRFGAWIGHRPAGPAIRSVRSTKTLKTCLAEIKARCKGSSVLMTPGESRS
uniref:Putative secreted protein n=1 Tax=Ixodes ricinus TaxID=34613 RepID=A0A6B0U5K8_IXORI